VPQWFRLLCGAALLLALSGGANVSRAGGEGERTSPRSESEDREYQIKAAFLLNFIRYTTWPEPCFDGPNAPVVLLVVGKDPFGDVLDDTFRGEQANGRRIVVERVRELPAEWKAHVIFCALGAKDERTDLIEHCRRRPVLVVGDTPGLAEDGAEINFFLSDKKTRFEINTDAVAEASLVMSPAVLKLAKIVKSKKQEAR
jgi:hypothetical protein